MADNNDQPLVSVIMIFLNAEAFMEEAIESVRSQTYPNWELIFVDDGSVDASTRIAMDYVRRFPERFRYVEHEGHANRGMSASRNLGIRHARGEYVAFLDADDVYLPEKLARQAELLDVHSDAAMVYGPTLHWYSWTGRPEDSQRDQLRRLGVAADLLIEPPTLIPRFLRLDAQTPGTCGVLVRRRTLDVVGGFEADFRGMFEDQVMMYKICLRFPVFVMAESFDRYRQHSESHSRVARRSGEYDPGWRPNPSYSAFLNWLEQYLIQHDVSDSATWEALNEMLWPYRHPVRYAVRERMARILTRGRTMLRT